MFEKITIACHHINFSKSKNIQLLYCLFTFHLLPLTSYLSSLLAPLTISLKLFIDYTDTKLKYFKL
jgi:hypothetical protein